MVARWIPNQTRLDEMTITFQVKRRNDPELFAWLRSIEYGRASETIRDVLRAAVTEGTTERGVSPAGRTQAAQTARSPTKGSSADTHRSAEDNLVQPPSSDNLTEPGTQAASNPDDILRDLSSEFQA